MANEYKECTQCGKKEMNLPEKQIKCPECDYDSLIKYKPWWAYGGEDEYIGLTKK